MKLNYKYEYGGSVADDGSLLLVYNLTKLRLKFPTNDKTHLEGEFNANHRCGDVSLDKDR